MTPMVDVTFLLLIFFMITAAFQMQRSIEMPLHSALASTSLPVREPLQEPRLVQIDIHETGSFLVMAPHWQRETPSKQKLLTALMEANDQSAERPQLIVKVHELARLRALVDVIDASALAGFSILQITQVDSFD